MVKINKRHDQTFVKLVLEKMLESVRSMPEMYIIESENCNMRNINLPNILKPYSVCQQPLKFLLYEFSVLPVMEKGSCNQMICWVEK